MACGTGPDHPTLGYFLNMTALASDTRTDPNVQLRRERTFSAAKPSPRSVDEQSGRHFETTRADTTYADAVLAYSGLGDDSLSFRLGAGAYTVSPDTGGLTQGNPGLYCGTWSCGPDFPFSQDSTRGAYGLDPNLQFDGVWEIQREQPIG